MRGGIVLCEPESLLSFKLSALESTLGGKDEATSVQDHFRSILETQYLFDKDSRDVIDESDVVFSTKSELTYTMGQKQTADFSPWRRRLIESILGLAAETIPKLSQQYPDKFEADSKRIRVLDRSASRMLAEQLAQRILDGELPEFSHVTGQEAHIREAMLQYVLEAEPAADAIATVEESFRRAHGNQILLLLRGLIGRGVLSHSLRKR